MLQLFYNHNISFFLFVWDNKYEDISNNDSNNYHLLSSRHLSDSLQIPSNLICTCACWYGYCSHFTREETEQEVTFPGLSSRTQEPRWPCKQLKHIPMHKKLTQEGLTVKFANSS